MAKIDLKNILIAAATAAAAQVAADPKTVLKPSDVPEVSQEVRTQIEKHPDVKQAQKTIDVLTNQEPWYMSVQAWTAIITSMMAILGIIGLAVPEEVQKTVLAGVPILVGFGVAVAMMYNRYVRFRDVQK
jgi:hypothetical protein